MIWVSKIPFVISSWQIAFKIFSVEIIRMCTFSEVYGNSNRQQDCKWQLIRIRTEKIDRLNLSSTIFNYFTVIGHTRAPKGNQTLVILIPLLHAMFSIITSMISWTWEFLDVSRNLCYGSNTERGYIWILGRSFPYAIIKAAVYDFQYHRRCFFICSCNWPDN